MNCIFCDKSTLESKSVEHIIPESLGNTTYILEKGIVCDSCNNYFSIKIEQPLLEGLYFKNIRHRLNIKSKKGKIPIDKGFITEPYMPVDFHKNNEGKISMSYDAEKLFSKPSKKKKFEIINIEFGAPLPNNPYVSKFLGKAAIEALAFHAITHSLNIDERVKVKYFDNLKRYVRKGNKDEFWPYYQRKIHPAEATFQHPENDEHYFSILMTMRFIFTEEGSLFHQILLAGVEYTIDLLNPTTILFEERLLKNNNRSYVFDGVWIDMKSRSPYEK